ncbi:hypothetical protein AVEN_1638-1 [Araneus ventricosus]|uniref:Uncharacterized protein n=1 Tax=Araneus ventricosus TaxID=182803 RepID=A0A4Y2UD21_ARAVE|nr:hypothetical protein AVEN_1638-1 [Araneus ventricosus]
MLAADVGRLMNLAYAECPLDIRESLAVQFFVDAIRDEDTQLSTRKFGVEADISLRALTMTSEDTWSVSEIQKAQLEDPNIRPILEKKLKSENRPSRQEIAQESHTTKRYWTLWDSLHLKDGTLYRKWENHDGSLCRWQLILPKSRIQEDLRETDGSASGEHFGVMKNLTRERFY